MAEPLPEISREQADLLLRQLHAALGTPRAGDRVAAFARGRGHTADRSGRELERTG